MPRHWYLICGTRFTCFNPTLFINGTNKSENGLRFQGWIGLLYGLSRTLTTCILPKIARPRARESLLNQQQSAIASTVIRDRLGRLTCCGLIFKSLSLNRLFVLILYPNLSRKSSKTPSPQYPPVHPSRLRSEPATSMSKDELAKIDCPPLKKCFPV